MNIKKSYKDENLYYYGYKFAVLVDRSQTKKKKLQRAKKQTYYRCFIRLQNALSFIRQYFGDRYYDRFVDENLFKIVK